MRVTSNETRPRAICVKGMNRIDLVPGNNEVDPRAWGEAKKLAVVQALLKTKDLEADEASIRDLAAFDEASAIGLVNGTVDRALLTAWGDAETRAGVLKAIDAQLDATEPPSKKKGAKKDDEKAAQ